MAKQKRWNSSKDGKLLASLFENGIADPKCTKVSEIDPIKGMREEFKDFSDQQFRNNYRTTAASYIAGKALEGTRYKALTCELTGVMSSPRFMKANISIVTISPD